MISLLELRTNIDNLTIGNVKPKVINCNSKVFRELTHWYDTSTQKTSRFYINNNRILFGLEIVEDPNLAKPYELKF